MTAHGRPLNVVLFVVDSLRKRSLGLPPGEGPRTPFLDQFVKKATAFERAYATECWTLPTHLSMFTGLLPSEHGAHFGTMAYRGSAPTIAEILSESGYHTEIFTRNTIFDGRLPGATRGFQHNTLTQVSLPARNPAGWFIALAKPNIRRHVRKLAFFSPEQKESREFIASYARSLFPADEILTERVLGRLSELQEKRNPFFLFCNLYDCHAPYPPVADNIARPVRSFDDLLENLFAFHALPKVSSHAYLRDGFRLPDRGRQALLSRYHRAIELMDGKLARFYAEASQRGLLDDTLFILTSDHGEAFGEHGLYIHDASVFEVHLSVPLWVRWPGHPPGPVEDVVSMRDLFGLMNAAASGDPAGTILDQNFREQHPCAVAEHFHYPRFPEISPRFRQNPAAVIADGLKAVVRRERTELYDVGRDPLELSPEQASLGSFEDELARRGKKLPPSVRHHLERWRPEP